VVVSVVSALEAELLAMPTAVRESTIAAGALVAAQILDGRPGTRDTASLLKELRAAVADLHELAAAVPEEADPIDELSRRRTARVADTAVQDRAAGGGQ
jgi:hypothetical protein